MHWNYLSAELWLSTEIHLTYREKVQTSRFKIWDDCCQVLCQQGISEAWDIYNKHELQAKKCVYHACLTKCLCCLSHTWAGHLGKAVLKSGKQLTPGQLCSFGVPSTLQQCWIQTNQTEYKIWGQTQCQRLPLEWGLGEGNIRASLTPTVNCREAARTHDLALRWASAQPTAPGLPFIKRKINWHILKVITYQFPCCQILISTQRLQLAMFCLTVVCIFL